MLQTRNDPVILMYHGICMPPEGARIRGLYVSPAMFRFQMFLIRLMRFPVIGLGDVVRHAKREADARKSVALTFDDGYGDFRENAFPVLRQYGFPATVFVVSRRAGEFNCWDTEETGVVRKLLTWNEIRELKNNGISFGSHTRTHPFLRKLGGIELDEEIAGSRRDIAERLSFPPEHFCYPYGDYDEKVADAVRTAGYSAAVTVRRGLVRKGDAVFEFRRSMIRHSTNPFLFLLKIATSYEEIKSGRT